MVLGITAPCKELQTNTEKNPVEAIKETSVGETEMGKGGTQIHVD
jgi:hypothetical protein